MTKYCPICESEYLDSVTMCVDDGAELTSEKPAAHLETAAYDIYAAANEIEAERIVSLLRSEDIDAGTYRANVVALPSESSLHFIITTPAHLREQAISLISDARRDGVISDTGTFI